MTNLINIDTDFKVSLKKGTFLYCVGGKRIYTGW